jgi:hypothetical protein
MTETQLAVLFFGGIITAFAILAVWAVKLYVQNKRAGIRPDKKKPVNWDDEIRRSVDESAEYDYPGGTAYVLGDRNSHASDKQRN